MQLYKDLITSIPEFKQYDIQGEEHYVDIGISPLGTIGSWLIELCLIETKNEILIKRICDYLNHIYLNADKFDRDIKNDFCVYLFWVLDYPTIRKIKNYLSLDILEDGRKYLKGIDRENYQEF